MLYSSEEATTDLNGISRIIQAVRSMDICILSQSPFFVLVVRWRTDFYHLQRAIFY